jgi:hypothetical protein
MTDTRSSPEAGMFELSIVDHIRFSFGSLVSACQGHAEAAARLTRWSWYGRAAVLVATGLAAACSLMAALSSGPVVFVAPTVGAIAFAVFAVHLAVDPERRAAGHRATAARLWLCCERCRALLAEIQDHAVDGSAIAARREALLKEVAEIFGQDPPADQATYDIAKTTLAGPRARGYSDQQIDDFLPMSLRRADRASA